jgi:hypothetical protein
VRNIFSFPCVINDVFLAIMEYLPPSPPLRQGKPCSLACRRFFFSQFSISGTRVISVTSVITEFPNAFIVVCTSVEFYWNILSEPVKFWIMPKLYLSSLLCIVCHRALYSRGSEFARYVNNSKLYLNSCNIKQQNAPLLNYYYYYYYYLYDVCYMFQTLGFLFR